MAGEGRRRGVGLAFVEVLLPDIKAEIFKNRRSQ